MEHEDQQVEQIKKFLREYGIWIGAGVVIGLGSLFAWRAWQSAELERQYQGTAAFQQINEHLQRDAEEDAMRVASQLVNELDDTSYAVIARLQMAQQAVRNGELEQAADMLHAAREQAGEPVIQALATTRLARVQLALGEYDAALNTLESSMPESFNGQIAEIRGDIYVAQGNNSEARRAYQSAVNEGGASVAPALRMKFDNLAGE